VVQPAGDKQVRVSESIHKKSVESHYPALRVHAVSMEVKQQDPSPEHDLSNGRTMQVKVHSNSHVKAEKVHDSSAVKFAASKAMSQQQQLEYKSAISSQQYQLGPSINEGD